MPALLAAPLVDSTRLPWSNVLYREYGSAEAFRSANQVEAAALLATRISALDGVGGEGGQETGRKMRECESSDGRNADLERDGNGPAAECGFYLN